MSKALCDPEMSLIRALITWGRVWGALHLKTGESLWGGGAGMHRALRIVNKSICVFGLGYYMHFSGGVAGDMGREFIMFIRFSKGL